MLHAKPRVGFLPIGQLRSDELTHHYQAGLELVQRLDADVIAMPPAAEALDVQRAAAHLDAAGIDLLIAYVLHGMSSVQQVSAALATDAPTLLYALPTNYSFSSAVSAIGTLRDRKRRATMVLAPAGDPRVLPEIQATARVRRAAQGLRQSRIGVIGSVMNNLVAAHYHRDVLAERLGPETVHITLSEVKGTLDSILPSEDAVGSLIEAIGGVCAVTAGPAALREAARFHLALRQLVDRLGLHAVAMECLTELVPLWGISPCLGFARPDEYLIGCEGDVVMTAQALLLYYLTGSDSYMGDIFALDERGVLTLRHCAAPLRLGRPGQRVRLADQMPPETLQLDRQLVMCKPQLARGPVTLTRLHGGACDQLHIAPGDLVEAEDDDRPIVHIQLRNPHAFLKEVCGNHYLVTSGDLREQLRLLGNWLGLVLSET